jgi:hypothetical protein
VNATILLASSVLVLTVVLAVTAWQLDQLRVRVREIEQALGFRRAISWRQLQKQLLADPDVECIRMASCEPGDHTFSNPCVFAPGTGKYRPDGGS